MEYTDLYIKKRKTRVPWQNQLWVRSYLWNMISLSILLFLVFHFVLTNQRERLFKEIRQNALNSAELLAPQLALSIFVWDKQSIEEKINIVLSNSNSIIYCAVYSRKFNEKLLFGPEAEKFIQLPSVTRLLSQHPMERIEDDFERDSKTFLHIIAPVKYQSDFLKWSSLPDDMLTRSPFEDDTSVDLFEKESTSSFIGDLHIGIKFDAAEESIKRSRNFFILLSIPIAIIALIFNYLQSHLITRKLSHLTNQAQNITDGDLEFKAMVKSNDEIGILSNSFEEMVTRLIRSQKEIEVRNTELEETNLQLDDAIQKIQSFNLELEKKVSNRTKELEGLNKTLQQKNQELEIANETKDRFLSMMSHELRTPLNAIIGFSQLALKRIQNDATRDFFMEIKNNGEHLLTLINDVLDFSKLEARQFELMFDSFDVNEVLQDVVSSTRALLQNKKIEIKISKSEKAKMAYGDRMRIKQVLLNLASNAVKFTHSGSIEFSCQPLNKNLVLPVDIPEKYYKKTMCVMVKDTGIGINPRDLPVIFDHFKQLDTSETRIHGTGLGLAITKGLLELHNTTIKVWSKENAGTSIFFLIPLSEKDLIDLSQDSSENNNYAIASSS